MNEKSYIFDTRTKEFLKNVPKKIISNSNMVKFKENDTLFKKSEKTEFGYILLSGELLVVNEFIDGANYVFSTLKPFTYLSDLECLSHTMKNAATVIASEESTLLKFPIEDFIYHLENDFNFLYEVSTSLANKLYHTSYERGKNVYRTGITKVINYLVTHCQKKEIKANDKLIINRTRELIASELGVSVKTVNRSVYRLEEKGLIELIKGKININYENYIDLLKLHCVD